MQFPNSINLENACNALESIARQQLLQSPELGAIELAAYALIFITTPRSPDESNDPQSLENLPRAIKEWTSKGHLWEAFMASWKEGIARDGTDEQRAFITYIEEPETEDSPSTDDKHDIETRPFADSLPQPNQALRILESLAQQYPSDSLNRVRVDFAIHTLRYTIEHDHVASLGKFLDDCGKRHEPFDDA